MKNGNLEWALSNDYYVAKLGEEAIKEYFNKPTTSRWDGYEWDARLFLLATKTSFKSSYWKTGHYPPGDKDKRDIFAITLSNENHLYQFTFGDSLQNTRGRKLKSTKPLKAYSVLACLQKYEVGGFEEFLGDFGYSMETREDREQARNIYKNMCNEYKNVLLLWPDPVDREQLQEIA